MKKLKLSRSTEVDVQQCMRNSSGNRFEMILEVAQRAREIALKNKREKRFDEPDSCITALLELQNKR